MTDALMEAIVAAPDDDAPRLVWADREGGERGELVVIQCRLARHDAANLEAATFARSLRVIGASSQDAEQLFAMFPALERVESPVRLQAPGFGLQGKSG